MTTNQPAAQPAPVIAFLGAGRMGSPMATNLARSGFACGCGTAPPAAPRPSPRMA